MEKIQDNNALCFKKMLKAGTPVLGIDYGEVRIGVAISDIRLVIASPWKTVAYLKDFDPLIKEVFPSGAVIGLPKQMDGTEGERAKAARLFGKSFEEKYNLPVFFWDERLSSKGVQRDMIDIFNLSRKKRKKIIDKSAASYILQGALDYLNRL